MRTCTISGLLCCCLLFCTKANSRSPASGQSVYGDAPYLLEPGWEPLLNGKDLSGWICLDKKKADSRTATRGVRWNYPENPRQLTAVSETGDRIVNTVRSDGASNICLRIRAFTYMASTNCRYGTVSAKSLACKQTQPAPIITMTEVR
jgi:hypothetical protein